MNKELLKNILEFLNKVPNRKYGDNYQLASEFTSYITEVDKSYRMQCSLLKECKQLLKRLKRDAKWALYGEWNKEDDGFKCQIVLINEMLEKLKNLKNEYTR